MTEEYCISFYKRQFQYAAAIVVFRNIWFAYTLCQWYWELKEEPGRLENDSDIPEEVINQIIAQDQEWYG